MIRVDNTYNKIIIRELSKNFVTGKNEIAALDGVNLEIEQGDFYCMLGPSGCGKSTLLRCLAGFEKVSAGEILIGKKKVTKPGPDRIMVFQTFDQLLPWKTVFENVKYPLRINGSNNKESVEIALKFLTMVGLMDFKDNYPHQLSGGMKQRVAIARALALQPKVLLMDEPFASVDPQTRSNLQKEVVNIWEQVKPTIIFITHSIEEAIILGNKIAIMSSRPGKVKTVLENKLDRPRKVGATGFDELWKQLNTLLEF